jgi:hypothetical protein
MHLLWKPQLILSLIYFLHFCVAEFSALTSPTIWWQSLELQCGTVMGLTLLKYIYDIV